MTLENSTATLFAAMGINPESRISSDGLTIPATHGNPIKGLRWLAAESKRFAS